MKKIICVLVSLFLCAPGATVCAAPEVSAVSAVLIEAESGKILYEKNARERRGPASTTKIMTALLCLEMLDCESTVKVPKEAAGTEGSSAYLEAGEKIKVRDLLYAMMLGSANDAAATLAIAAAGSTEAFACLMNKKAREMGLENTSFENPHGLDGENHYTTAYELAKIAACAMQNESFAEIVSSKTKTVSIHGGKASRVFKNHNRLLFSYNDIIGVKTGFTKKCGRTLVSAAQRDGLVLIAVTLCDSSDWLDHRQLLDYGFSLYSPTLISEKGVLRFTLADGSHAVNGEEISCLLPEGAGSAEIYTEIFKEYAEPSDIIGKVHIKYGGKAIKDVPLIKTE